MTFNQANAYCESFNSNPNQKYVRLPTRNELLSIVNYRKRNPAIDEDLFVPTTPGIYWTKTERKGVFNPEYWTVNFKDGTSYFYSDTAAFHARCVIHFDALPPLPPTTHYKVGTETVYDYGTKLTWQRDSSDKSLSYEGAVEYCPNRRINNQDWRLPTFKELISLVDTSRVKPTLDPAFRGAVTNRFISTTPMFDEEINFKLWSIDFNRGAIPEGGAVSSGFVRCVKQRDDSGSSNRVFRGSVDILSNLDLQRFREGHYQGITGNVTIRSN
ncbi:DUF1566 domain-containing protein [bacterium]|nr:DUF1566 domain-containing protein [bacterium]